MYIDGRLVRARGLTVTVGRKTRQPRTVADAMRPPPNPAAEDVRREDLIVLEVRVDEGPRYKRIKSKNRGGRHPIQKKTSHLTVVVGVE